MSEISKSSSNRDRSASGSLRRPKYLAAVKLHFADLGGITRTYGGVIAQEIRKEIHQRALAICSGDSDLQLSWGRDGLLVRVKGLDIITAKHKAGRLLNAFIIKICAEPIETTKGLMVPPVSAYILDIVGSSGGRWGASHLSENPLSGKSDDDGWSHVDMAKAARLFSALSRREVLVQSQTVTTAPGGRNAFYQACILVVTSQVVGQPPLPMHAFGTSLHKLGLTSLAEAMFLGIAIKLLRQNKDLILGCSISWPMEIDHTHLQRILRRLEYEPNIAKRLVLELNLDEMLCEKAAIEFIKSLRKSKVKIAITGFGEILYPIDFLVESQPDVIKIDIKGKKLNTANSEVLRKLVDLAKSFTSFVVIHGIDDEASLQKARASGITWQQGSYISSPWEILDPFTFAEISHEHHIPIIDDQLLVKADQPTVGAAGNIRYSDTWRVSGAAS